MKTVIFSREGMDYSRAVSEFAEMFSRKYPQRKVEVNNPDTREGAAMMSMLGVYRYPAVVVVSDDGRVVQMWQEEQLPLLDDVASSAIA